MLTTALHPIVILGHRLWCQEASTYRKSLGLKLVRRPSLDGGIAGRRVSVKRIYASLIERASATGSWVPDNFEPWIVR